MNQALENHFLTLEKQRAQLLSEIKDLSVETLNRSRNNKWSINQIVGHVVAAEKLSIGYITKKMNAIHEVSNTGFWNELKLWVYIMALQLPLKFKAPKVLGEKPPTYSDVNSLIKDWDETRLRLKGLLENFPVAGLRKKIYRHPAMGRCNVIHALISFREHAGHHYPQIKKQI